MLASPPGCLPLHLLLHPVPWQPRCALCSTMCIVAGMTQQLQSFWNLPCLLRLRLYACAFEKFFSIGRICGVFGKICRMHHVIPMQPPLDYAQTTRSMTARSRGREMPTLSLLATHGTSTAAYLLFFYGLSSSSATHCPGKMLDAEPEHVKHGVVMTCPCPGQRQTGFCFHHQHQDKEAGVWQ